jgi:hypothetical protein
MKVLQAPTETGPYCTTVKHAGNARSTMHVAAAHWHAETESSRVPLPTTPELTLLEPGTSPGQNCVPYQTSGMQAGLAAHAAHAAQHSTATR